jgi:hypothetical protein
LYLNIKTSIIIVEADIVNRYWLTIPGGTAETMAKK